MSNIYGEQHRALQQSFDTVQLADRVQELIVLPEIPENHKSFIETRDMFFLPRSITAAFPPALTKAARPASSRF